MNVDWWKVAKITTAITAILLLWPFLLLAAVIIILCEGW